MHCIKAVYINSLIMTPPVGDITDTEASVCVCVAANGSPQAEVRWFLQDGSDITGDSEYVVTGGEVEDTFTVTSTLTYMFSRQDSSVHCEANQLGVKRDEKTSDIDVLCKTTFHTK